MSAGARPRIVLVAAGVVTPIGQDVDAFWSSLLTGVDGISTIERFPVGDLRVGRGGEIKKLTRVKDWAGVPECRATRVLISAADDLSAQAGLRARGIDPRRLAVVVGTALGGVEEGEHALAGDRSARRLRGAFYDSPAHNLARWLGARGPAITVSTACASGASSLGLGADLLRHGQADAVVAGGYDVLCRFVMRGFDALRSLTRDRVRPFDRRRSGLLLGEGAGLVLMMRESEAGGRRLGTLLGHASVGDGAHISAPHPEGRGLERAVRMAMAQADAEPGPDRARERARDGDHAQRPHRDRGPQARPGRAGARRARQLDQVHDGAHDGRRGHARGRDVPLCRAPRAGAAHASPRGARPRVRPRLRARASPARRARA